MKKNETSKAWSTRLMSCYTTFSTQFHGDKRRLCWRPLKVVLHDISVELDVDQAGCTQSRSTRHLQRAKDVLHDISHRSLYIRVQRSEARIVFSYFLNSLGFLRFDCAARPRARRNVQLHVNWDFNFKFTVTISNIVFFWFQFRFQFCFQLQFFLSFSILIRIWFLRFNFCFV